MFIYTLQCAVRGCEDTAFDFACFVRASLAPLLASLAAWRLVVSSPDKRVGRRRVKSVACGYPVEHTAHIEGSLALNRYVRWEREHSPRAFRRVYS